MKKQTTTVVIAAVIMILSLFYFLGGQDKKKGAEYLTLVLEYGDGEKQQFRTSSLEEKKVWSLLQNASALSNIALEPTSDFNPKRIDGFPNGFDGKEWNFYINDVKQNKSPFNVKVKSPDKVVFRFE